MSSARIIYPPLSGRDRRHYSRELHKGEQEHARLMRESEVAHATADRLLAEAHRLDCLAWSARLFIGGPDEPSPTIEVAIHGQVTLLEVQCRHCNHGEVVDLALAIWPRERPIHTLARALYCRRCQATHRKKRRPALTALRMSGQPDPTSPARAKGKAP